MPGRLPASEPDAQALQRWFESDEPGMPFDKHGGGRLLEFIAPAPEQRIPFSNTHLHFSWDSLQSGWVTIEQCHEGLDPVPDAELVYRFRRFRHLGISAIHAIGDAWVIGQTVQLKKVGEGARLCVELQAQLLTRLNDGRYRLRYGPFERRFLDSYFPLHVSLDVAFPPLALTLDQVTPAPTEGFELVQAEDRVALDAWFRGMLSIELLFRGGDYPCQANGEKVPACGERGGAGPVRPAAE